MTLARFARPLLAVVLAAPLAAGLVACGSARRVAGDPIPECVRCHGAPPATGAHLVHANPVSVSNVRYGDLHVLEDVAPAGASPASYDFGCGNCHPLDVAAHLSHVNVTTGPRVPDVVLDPAGAPSTSLRARNGALARYDAATRTCSDVYCHSSGQDPLAVTSLSYRTTPAWDGPQGALGCDGCHGNPPRYPSGGPGTPTANGHLSLDDFGWETGHFAGMAGPSHGSKHGGGNTQAFANDPQQAATPITCQACHFETVEAAAGRFFFFDPTGSYSFAPGERAGLDSFRTSQQAWQHGQCRTCHAGGREGRVRPLRHVNGRRDVAFDRRASLPDDFVTGLPTLAEAVAVRPYYVTKFQPQETEGGATRFRLISDSAFVQTVTSTATGRVFMTTLESASYDPATKTCENVGCHVGQQSLVDAGIASTLVWGRSFVWFSSCRGCHNEMGPVLPP